MGFLIFVVVVVAAVVAWKMRVQLIAKITGQEPSRIQRQIDRRRD